MNADDTMQIHQLMALYGHLADWFHSERNRTAGREIEVEEVFTPDCVFEFDGDRRTGLDGARSVFTRVAGEEIVAAHHVTNVYVYEVDDQVRVHSKWLTVTRDSTTFTGDYHDVVVRTPGGWKVSNRLASMRSLDDRPPPKLAEQG